MKRDLKIIAAFKAAGLEYTGQLPHSYGANGKRAMGLCGRCRHFGSDCKCSPRSYWLWWLEVRARKRAEAAGPTMLAALQQLGADWPFLSDQADQTEINGADFLEAMTLWWQAVARPAMLQAEKEQAE